MSEENDNILTTLDTLYLTIDTLDIMELDKITKYIEEQKLIIDIIERRKVAITNELKSERIKLRRELNNLKIEYEKKYPKKSNNKDDESSVEEPVKKTKSKK